MNKFDTFYFEWFSFDKTNLIASFTYSFDEVEFFEEKMDFSSNFEFNLRKNLDDEIINNILFHISIMLWISYYKANPTKNLIVKTGILDDFQKDFFSKIYKNWLGEFLYRNDINPDWLFNFISVSDKKFTKIEFETSKKAMLPIWWGKDSLVSAELLKEIWIDYDLITLWKDYKLYSDVSDVIWSKRIKIKRSIDSKLFELNKNFSYNWHVPITAIIAFNLELVAYLYDYKYIILSNEKSANEWNISWKWLEVNHQYSKSLEFEQDFWDYVSRYISSDVKYFSLLRPLYELKIAEYFSKYKKYFPYFSSCNNNFKIIESNKTTNDKWCLNCPKCAFVYTILRPFLDEKEILEIFWKEMYEDKNQEKLFRELAWISGIKPFECVWTNEEVILAMKMDLDKLKKENKKIPYMLEIFEKEVLLKMSEKEFSDLEEKIFQIYNEDIIPSEIKNKLF